MTILPLLIFAQTGRAKPPVKPKRPPVAAPANTEVPFRVGEDAIIVDATLNGRKISCMFDTGFGGTVVLNTGIDIGPVSGSMTLRDFVGEMEAPTVKIKSLKLGPKTIAVKDLSDVVQTDQGDLSFNYNQHVDGIMGLDVIKSEITTINFEKKKFIFHPKSHDISKLKPDNKRTFLAKLLPIGNNSLEMAVTVPSGKMMTLALDTGNAFYATTHTDVLTRIGLWKLGTKVKYMGQAGVASGAVDSYSFRMPKASIFGVPVENSMWDIIDLPSSSAEGDGTIGFGFLKNFNITIDYGRRRVWLENWTGKVKDPDLGEVGISAGYDPTTKRTRIYAVAPESPAAVAGLERGDSILEVEGVDTHQMGYRRMRRLLEGPVGSKIKIAASRNGGLKRYELERKVLVNEVPKDEPQNPSSKPSGGR